MYFIYVKFMLSSWSFLFAALGVAVIFTLLLYFFYRDRLSPYEYIKTSAFIYSFIPTLVIVGFLLAQNNFEHRNLTTEISGYSTGKADYYYLEVLGMNKYVYDSSITEKVNKEGIDFYKNYSVNFTLIPIIFDCYIIIDIKILK